MSDEILAPGFKEDPYWWEAAPRPKLAPEALPEKVDVAVVGSGFTGLSAALTLARGGRSVAVIEAEDPGYGASTRNAGFVGKTFKHSLGEMLEAHGDNYAVAAWRETYNAFDYTTDLIEGEEIDCNLERCGRFMAALSPRHYEAMGRELELKRKHLGAEGIMVPRAEQHNEIGSDLYHGGQIVPDLAAVHPGLYQLGLLDRAEAAGARIIANTPVTGLGRDKDGFTVATSRGTVRAREVVMATNGYTGPAAPAIRRRVVPFRAYMIATEPVPRELLDRLFPQGRTYHDYNNNLFYMRPSPDRSRILLGGYTGSLAPNLKSMGKRLHKALARIFPDLATVRLSHVWTGFGSGSFDLYPHTGVHDGVHYAMGYCFAGLPMGTYLGHKTALRILDSPDAATIFDGRPFPTRPYYWGAPWFVPFAVAWFNWQDRQTI
jgi:glycine/D-amino acid oxidase-like deaminating enzyme